MKVGSMVTLIHETENTVPFMVIGIEGKFVRLERSLPVFVCGVPVLRNYKQIQHIDFVKEAK